MKTDADKSLIRNDLDPAEFAATKRGNRPSPDPGNRPSHDPDSLSETASDTSVEQNWKDMEISAQPEAEDGVTSGMATAALDQTLLRPEDHSAASAGEQYPEEALSRSEEALSGSGGPLSGAAESALTDAEIMLRVREGDDSGFDFLIAKYRKPIIHFMFRMVHNQGVAEELAQEVFLRVYRSRQTYRAEARFSTWLYRIATNLGVNHARDTKHERAASNVYLDMPDAETGTRPDLADDTPTVEQDLLQNERLQAIRMHVMALPERQRNAVLMHKYQGMDYKQIGEVLKLSESATKSLLFRAYQTLRERLKDFV